MPVSDRDIALQAFSTDEWRSAADALFQATGVSVNAMDFEAGEPLNGGARCGHCHLVTDVVEPGPHTCFDRSPVASADTGRAVCRAGLAALYSPVRRDACTLGHVVVSGFVTSTRERRGLYEHLLSRGVGQDAARRSIKALPVISRRHAESYLQIALATARTVVDATAQRLDAAERIEALRYFVSSGHDVVASDHLDTEELSAIAEEAVALAGGVAGAILRPRGPRLEVVARAGDWRGRVGATVPRATTASGRALEIRKPVVVSSDPDDTSTLAMPLMVGQRVVGVLEARLSEGALPFTRERLSRVARFGQFVAIALEREDERRRTERALAGYTQLNILAASLGGQTEVTRVGSVVSGALETSFACDMAGFVLTGWGHDRAAVKLQGAVTDRDVEHVLGIVAGRDIRKKPFGAVSIDESATPRAEGIPAQEWAVCVAEMAHGDLNVGWLFLARSDGERYTAQDNALLAALAAHAGAAFGRTTLYARIRDDYASTIAALSAGLGDGRASKATRAGRVMEHAVLIGEELSLGIDELEQLRFAGLLHDVGGTGVPEEILIRPLQTEADGMASIAHDPATGASILDQIAFLKSLTPVILHHHEHWDGSGQPQGLRGKQIPLLARVLAVADAYDALTAERSSRRRKNVAQARAEIELVAGTHLDPRVVKALSAVLDRMALAGASGLFAPAESLSRPDLPV